ncbi:glycosyltransferase [Pseudactinotalea suaedae]|uniref:glycosyltransferase n=1 Tax=Pseudactinotalea suaedae TaxID=1524924 RepID=UPI0013908BCE|nr:glycosyltransferase [Pseudactinotalea suaedae]
MRVTLVGGGSRGDVQPVVALALGIQAAGHDVTVAASVDSESLVTEHGLRFARFDVSITQQMQTAAGRAWVADSAGRPFRELRNMARVYAETARPLADGVLTLSGTADLFISGVLSLDSMASIAQHDGVAHATALLCPFHPTTDGRAGLTARSARTSPANLTRTRMGRWLLSRSVTQAGQLVRRDLGLPETGPQGFIRALDSVPAVLGASPLLVPTPPDWPSTVTVTGSWTLSAPAGWEVPAALADFLDAGPPPVYLGFGSMSVVQPERIREVAVEAARAAGVRLLLSGTDLDGPHGDDVLGIADVPHTWLFPRVRAVVHHGGAGTTHAALLAGVPQLAVPHIADQPYWGRRIHEEKLGPPPLSLHRLTPQRLTERLRALVESPELAQRAAEAGQEARQEPGVANAVEALLAS